MVEVNRFKLVQPRFVPPLDENFRPAVLANLAFEQEVGPAGAPLVIGLDRGAGGFSRFETRVFAPDAPQAAANFYYVERLV